MIPIFPSRLSSKVVEETAQIARRFKREVDLEWVF